jgi:hypothetical protein
MNQSKPLNELTYEELCRHIAENQQIIESNTKRPSNELILYCESCHSHYNIEYVYGWLPSCTECYPLSYVTIKESELPHWYDRHLDGLCKLLVRAAKQLNEDKANDYKIRIYEYIFGEDVRDNGCLHDDNLINGYPYDFVCEYSDYACSDSGVEQTKPDMNEMLDKLYDEIDGLFQLRDELLRKIDYKDLRSLQQLGMDIPKHIVWYPSINQNSR